MTSLRQDVGPVMVVEVPIEAVSDHIPEVRGKPHEDVKTVELIEGSPSKTTKVGGNLTSDQEDELVT